jgi:4-diphosphocytidyl-2-C-methyl-D-erythritol kinase
MLTKLAPAKINLFLRVLRRRPDNYHDLASAMQQITLYDELIFIPKTDRIVLQCPGGDLTAPEDNLVFRAAEAFFSYTGFRPGIEIILKKNIPIAAGLGGGSSDAAATLMALNEIYSASLTKTQLMKLGVKLGADVPFFIFGHSALACGIGDKLKVLPEIPKLNLVLINPSFPLSTKMVYEKLTLRLTKKKNNYSIPRFCALGDIVRELHNDLESVSMLMYPELQTFKKMLLTEGALGALMSGSGPTLFGIFADEKSARVAQDAITKKVSGECLVFFAQSL